MLQHWPAAREACQTPRKSMDPSSFLTRLASHGVIYRERSRRPREPKLATTLGARRSRWLSCQRTYPASGVTFPALTGTARSPGNECLLSHHVSMGWKQSTIALCQRA